MKKQIIFIRGGETFEKTEDFYEYLRTVKIDPYNNKKNWRDWIIWALSETYDVLVPAMPAKQNSDYIAWKIWFERYLDFINKDSPVVVGSSLGATFLLKYLSENNFPKKISQLHLIAPMVEDDNMYLERMATFQFDIKKIDKIKDICGEIHLWHSEDDPVVPFKNSLLVKENLSNANLHSFKDRGHFAKPAFLELLEVINKIK